MHPLQASLAKKFRSPQTLARKVEFSGIGLHTGKCVNMALTPAPVGRGIVFKRIDLPGQPEIPASVEYVQATERRSVIGIGEARVHTVEHVLAAVKAFNIDNLVVELSDAEPPVACGSAIQFVKMIREAGVVEQEGQLPIYQLSQPVFYSSGECHLVALPYEGLKLSYTLYYPNSPAIGAQYVTMDLSEETFTKEIAPCRTFSLYEEVSMLMDHGLIKGGSLDNSVVCDGEAVFSKEGLHFPNEMARHKLLDLIGDLSLVGFPFECHVMAIRSGHTSNVAFAQEVYHHIAMEKSQS